MIDRDFLDSLDLNLFELANGQFLDAVKGPAVGEPENAEPCLERSFVHRIFPMRRQQTHEAHPNMRYGGLTGCRTPKGSVRNPRS